MRARSWIGTAATPIRVFLLGSILGLGSCASLGTREAPPAVHDAEFAGWIGVARRDITPPEGIYARNWGAAAHEVAEGVHRPLTATVLAIRERADGVPLILAALDLGWWRTLDDERYVRGALLDALSVDPARVMINLSHTHAGPSLCREDREKPGGHLIEAYFARVRDALVEAAREALRFAGPATLTWGQGRCDLARNRDLADPEKDRVVCGFNPSAPADDALVVGRVADGEGRIVATIVNYACHPTIMSWRNRLISPDFVGALRETVEAASGKAPCLFLQGASGDLGARESYADDPQVADRAGRQLGHAALSVVAGMLPPRTRLQFAGVVESGAPLATWRRSANTPSSRLDASRIEVELALKPLPSVAEIEADLKACEDRVQAERLRRKKRVRQVVGEGTVASAPLWIWRVGDAFLVGQPNEAYSRLQTDLRRAFAGRALVVMNLVNGSIGYLPTQDLYGLDLYQVWQTPFERGSLERLIEAAREAVVRLSSP